MSTIYPKSILEERVEVNNIAERDAISPRPAGKRVYVRSDDESYIWTGSEWINYTRLNGDGDCPVPEVGLENENKVLTAGARPGELNWKDPAEIIGTYRGDINSRESFSGLVPVSEDINNEEVKYLNDRGAWDVPHDTTYEVYNTEKDGLVPTPGEVTDPLIVLTAKDGWYYLPEFTPSTETESGKAGLVPAPVRGDSQDGNYYLNADGRWTIPNNTEYNVFNRENDGLVPKSGDKSADGEYYLSSYGTWLYLFDDNYVFNTDHNGLVPKPTAEEYKNSDTLFLNSSGGYTKPQDTTYEPYNGSAGETGLVPIPPETPEENMFLCVDGTWKSPADFDTTYTAFTKDTAGLVPSPGVSSNKVVLASDGTWVPLPTSAGGGGSVSDAGLPNRVWMGDAASSHVITVAKISTKAIDEAILTALNITDTVNYDKAYARISIKCTSTNSKSESTITIRASLNSDATLIESKSSINNQELQIDVVDKVTDSCLYVYLTDDADVRGTNVDPDLFILETNIKVFCPYGSEGQYIEASGNGDVISIAYLMKPVNMIGDVPS